MNLSPRLLWVSWGTWRTHWGPMLPSCSETPLSTRVFCRSVRCQMISSLKRRQIGLSQSSAEFFRDNLGLPEEGSIKFFFIRLFLFVSKCQSPCPSILSLLGITFGSMGRFTCEQVHHRMESSCPTLL